jgi:hypothetical protein
MKKLLFVTTLFSTLLVFGSLVFGAGPPPKRYGEVTASDLAAGTSTTPGVVAAKTLADTYAGASAEVVDEAMSTANFNDDTSHAPSQDAVHDWAVGIDTDLDGSVTDETWYSAVVTAAEIGAAYDTEAELNALFAAKQNTLTNEAGLYSALSDVSDFVQTSEIDTLAELESVTNGGAYMSDLLAATSKANFHEIVDLEAGTDFYSMTAADLAFQPLETTLTDIADGTITENLVNTANPWADNEVTDTLTIDSSSTVSGLALTISGITTETTIATDDLILIYDTSATANRAMTRGNFVAGIGAGQAIVLDLGDDGGDDTSDLGEIATQATGLANAIFTYPSADKLLIDYGKPWPNATLAATVTIADSGSTDEENALVFTPGGDVDGGNLALESDANLTFNPSTNTLSATEFSGGGSGLTAVDAATGDSATGFFDAGTIEHEYGGLEANVSAYAGLVAISGGSTSNITDGAGLETILSLGAYASDILACADSDALVTALGLAAGDIPDISGTYEVQLTNEAGLYGVLSDVTDFTQPGENETITGNWVNTTNPWADNEVSDTITVGASGSVNISALPYGTAYQLLQTNSGGTAAEWTSSPSFSELNLPSSDADPSTTDGQIKHDSTVTGMSGGALRWYEGTLGSRMVVDLDTDPSNDDYVVSYDADNDKFYMKVDADSGGATAWDDITNPDADDTIALAGYEIGFSTTLDEASHVAFKIDHTDTDVTAATTIFQIQSVDDADPDLTYINIVDDTGETPNSVFSVGANGAISVDAGLTAATTVIAEQLTSTDDIDATGTITGGTVTDGTVTLVGDGTITGVSVGGLPDNIVDNGMMADSAIDTAELAADAVEGTKIADDQIDSEHYVAGSIDNEHLADDAVAMDELDDDGNFTDWTGNWTFATGTITFSNGFTSNATLDQNEDVDIDFDANDEEVSIVSTATDYAAGSGIVTIYDDGTGQTNASYLLRLAREADADEQDNFILCEDNSTGAAGNGDDRFKVDSDGDTMIAGDLQVWGNYSMPGNGTYSFGTGAVTMGGTLTLGDAGADADSEPITLIQGAQTGDPQVVMDLTADANGDFSITTDTGDIVLSSAADITLTGANLILSDGVVFQTASDPNAMTLAAAGELTLTQKLNADGGIEALTPVVDAAADFAANFTGANLYGGTFICDTAGTIQLPAIGAGMNFTIITKGDIAVVVEPDSSDMMMLDGVDLDDADSATNTSSAGDIIVFQYMSAAGWVATSNGWTDED